MRKLPQKRNKRQSLIIRAVEDFYNRRAEKNKSIRKIALFLMGRKARLGKLTPEEKEALWYVKKNLKDKTYTDGLNRF